MHLILKPIILKIVLPNFANVPRPSSTWRPPPSPPRPPLSPLRPRPPRPPTQPPPQPTLPQWLFLLFKTVKGSRSSVITTMTKITKNGQWPHLDNEHTHNDHIYNDHIYNDHRNNDNKNNYDQNLWPFLPSKQGEGGGGRVTFSNKNRRCCDSIGIVTYHALQMTMTMTMTMFPKLVTEKHFFKTILGITI